jgi:hypothetical protein
MRSRSAFVVTPPEDGWQVVQGTARFLHGGERYRALADRILSPHAEVVHLDWVPDTLREVLDARQTSTKHDSSAHRTSKSSPGPSTSGWDGSTSTRRPATA